ALHFWLNMGLATAVGVHIAAALKHAVIDRDGVVKRMLP
ncbi:MAG: cytochrome b, partial [Massilia sp.]|nr:cytochrome b [Massilia sp.]